MGVKGEKKNNVYKGKINEDIKIEKIDRNGKGKGKVGKKNDGKER